MAFPPLCQSYAQNIRPADLFEESDIYIVIEANKNLRVYILEREYYMRRAIEKI